MQAQSSRNSFAGLLALVAMLAITLAGCSQRAQGPAKTAGSGLRIVSTAPSLTEMLYAIGAGGQLIGRTSACDWPVEAKKVQVVGPFGRPSLEMLASLKPDLVVDVDLADDNMGKRIAAMGIRRERIRCQTPEDVPAALRSLGRLTGHAGKADSLAAVIEKGLASYRAEASRQTKKVHVYLEIWDDPLWTGGKHSFTSAMIAYAGGQNIGDAVDKEYFEISPEWVIGQDPEVIACMYMSKETPAVEAVRSRAGWSGIDAVRHARIYGNFDNNIYLRPGPRVLEGIAGLKKLFEAR